MAEPSQFLFGAGARAGEADEQCNQFLAVSHSFPSSC